MQDIDDHSFSATRQVWDLTQHDWRLSVVGGGAEEEDDPVPATVMGRSFEGRVPGCVHTDLQRAGVLDDCYVGSNETACRWVAHCDWVYSTQLLLPPLAPSCHVDLVFHCLDTLGTL